MKPVYMTLLSLATILLGGTSLLAVERADQCTLVEFTVETCPTGVTMQTWCTNNVGGTRGCPAEATGGSCTDVAGAHVVRCEFAAAP